MANHQDTTLPELLPCPFCGVQPFHRNTNEGTHYIECDNEDCYTLTQSYFCRSYEKAVEAWNRRVPANLTLPISTNPTGGNGNG